MGSVRTTSSFHSVLSVAVTVLDAARVESPTLDSQIVAGLTLSVAVGRWSAAAWSPYLSAGYWFPRAEVPRVVGARGQGPVAVQVVRVDVPVGVDAAARAVGRRRLEVGRGLARAHRAGGCAGCGRVPVGVRGGSGAEGDQASHPSIGGSRRCGRGQRSRGEGRADRVAGQHSHQPSGQGVAGGGDGGGDVASGVAGIDAARRTVVSDQSPRLGPRKGRGGGVRRHVPAGVAPRHHRAEVGGARGAADQSSRAGLHVGLGAGDVARHVRQRVARPRVGRVRVTQQAAGVSVRGGGREGQDVRRRLPGPHSSGGVALIDVHARPTDMARQPAHVDAGGVGAVQSHVHVHQRHVLHDRARAPVEVGEQPDVVARWCGR